MENENIVVQSEIKNEQVTANKTKNNKKRQKRKLGWLFTLTGVTALVLIVETYAWFIGTGSINTSEFEIGVSTEESLFLSLDGSHWGTSLKITKENVLASPTGQSANKNEDHYAYEGHTNSWVEDGIGLIPISTYGEIDTTVSRLKLFGKSSLTATKGGYRLISTRIDNYSAAEDGEGYVSEQGGYVAFDLFIKNGEGTDYIAEFNAEDDEAIYLTTNSSVTVAKEGTDTEEDYGLANSVRIAFAQIGRIASHKSIYSASNAVSITCETTTETDNDGKVTGLCEDTKPTIWEPNDKLHDAELIKHFNRVCKGRSEGADGKIVYGDSENAKCITLTEESEEIVHTYVVKEDIVSQDNVDVYDGINGFEVDEDYKLGIYENTFTDSHKIEKDEKRPAFFKLAANSVTKIRVYIYLEGQDVDNYDLISLGKKIKINFGFTKDQFDLQDNEGYKEPTGESEPSSEPDEPSEPSTEE